MRTPPRSRRARPSVFSPTRRSRVEPHPAGAERFRHRLLDCAQAVVAGDRQHQRDRASHQIDPHVLSPRSFLTTILARYSVQTTPKTLGSHASRYCLATPLAISASCGVLTLKNGSNG